MNTWIVVAIMAAAGASMSFQAPINANLGQAVGRVEAALVSFGVGTLILIAAVALAGQGSLAGLRHVPWWQYLGGLIGAVFVSATLWSAPKVGVTAMVIAALAGQMVAALAIDQFGWMGIPRRPIEPQRVLGVALLVGSVILINWKKAYND